MLDFRVRVAALPALLARRPDAAHYAPGDAEYGEDGDPEEPDAQGDAENGVCPVVGGLVAHGAAVVRVSTAESSTWEEAKPALDVLL